MRTKFPVTVHLLFYRDGQVLLLRRFNTGFEDGNYSVPAGHLDGGETVRMAAQRKALEEVGVHIDIKDIDFATVMHRKSDDERVDFFVHIKTWEGKSFNAEPDKCDELHWCDMDAPLEPLVGRQCTLQVASRRLRTKSCLLPSSHLRDPFSNSNFSTSRKFEGIPEFRGAERALARSAPLNSDFFRLFRDLLKLVVSAKFRPLASHGTPLQRSKSPHRCDTRRHGRSDDQQRGRLQAS